MTANFPKCITIGSNAFYNCNELTSINFSLCSIISNSAFYNCTKLISIKFPDVTQIAVNAFNYCTNLIMAEFTRCQTINMNIFASCYNLLSLYLLNSTIASLVNINAFYSTPIDGYTTATNGVYGSIYVPASLVDSYKSADNWSYFADRFVGLTDEEIEALNS